MTTGSVARARPAARRRTVRQFVPPQHGAWAMLVVPWLVGVLAAGFRWAHLPLFGAWLSGYLLSYYALQAVKTRRPRRFRAQLLAYGPPTILFGGLVVALYPTLLWYAPAYAVLLAVNVGYAWRRRERAVVNDLASVLQSCLMVFVAATVAGVPVTRLGMAFLAVLAYFAGTVLYVKTMIRERGSTTYRVVSVLFHLLALGLSVWWGWPLTVLFGLLLLRAWLLPQRRATPKQVGILEIVNSLLLIVALALTLG
ncbi:YwiC-like family protein [Micromonospora polyrhachis]|uniref:ABC-type multidrug transport system fused ATPase/permease subunit n=1 Tax=Micromonospora polyrhachis TaxID=1282883 RepID=A0A7W7SW11_9ACTN|nr:YwiC-like family protein [Micromonospora polyrhachis]MBB4961913.1 ABC-type multidrug transport system fused ATPase/permease subunit [Micromonospora polyrhachis]